MASRVIDYWRSAMNRLGETRRFGTKSWDFSGHPPTKARLQMKGEFAPIYVALGLIVLSVTIGLHTAKQQLAYSPGVSVSKKKRESVPEVDEPDDVVEEADQFIKNSIFRKVARVQDIDRVRAGVTDPSRPDPFDNRLRKVENLKTVGVEPNPVGN